MKLKQIKYIGTLVACSLSTHAFGIIDLAEIDEDFLACGVCKEIIDLEAGQELTKDQIRTLCISGKGGFKITTSKLWKKDTPLSKNTTEHVLKLFYTCHIFLRQTPTKQQKAFLEKIAHNVLYSYLSLKFSNLYTSDTAKKEIKEALTLAIATANNIQPKADGTTAQDKYKQEAETILNDYNDSDKYKWKGYVEISEENKRKLSENLKKIKEDFEMYETWISSEEKEKINPQIKTLTEVLDKQKITQKEEEDAQRTINKLNQTITGIKNDCLAKIANNKAAKQEALNAITASVAGKTYITEDEDYKALLEALKKEVEDEKLSELNDATVKILKEKITELEKAENDRLTKIKDEQKANQKDLAKTTGSTLEKKSAKKVKGSVIIARMSKMQKLTMGHLITETEDYTEEAINKIPNRPDALMQLFKQL